MTTTANPQPGAPQEASQKVEAYLSRLRGRLRGLDDAEASEIVAELRSHILDKATAAGELSSASVDAALAALGSPDAIAGEYLTDNLLARAEVSRSPLQLLRGLWRWASLSVAGFLVLLGAVIGYFFGVVFILVAVAKLFHPRTAGLWIIPDGSGDYEMSFRLGFGDAPSGGRDLLGWWIVPIGWLAGCALILLTTSAAVWFVRKYRRSRDLP